MGRGLSELQKCMLTLAYHNRIEENRTLDEKTGADVYRYEIIAEYYKFPAYRMRVFSNGERIVGGGHHFRVSEIGKKRYHAAMSAVHRAINRIEQRGLITVRVGRYAQWKGLQLTETGLAIAEKLTVKTLATLHKVQPIGLNT